MVRGSFSTKSADDRASRKALEAERAGSGEQVEHSGPRNIALKNAHPCFADAIESRAHVAAGRRFDSSPTPPASDNAHSGTSCEPRRDVGDSRLKAAHSPVLIAFQAKSDIDRDIGAEFARARSHAPSDRLELAGAGRESKLEPVATNDFRRRSKLDVSRNQHRRRIAHSKRLEMPEHPLEIVVGAFDCDFEVDANIRNEIVERQVRRGNRIEARCELFDLIACDRDSGRHSVAAISKEKIATLFERIAKMKARDAAS